ncbi:uncharacterized protein LOC135830143 [Sycon ciliatum]|uniref:uncharacterized protein LOC135830143 n=1 Tax=Sycon ciliatum TaxID=27933 RepID=UPI0020AA1968|eukprot:scpid75852/ scgid17086/ 
MARLEIPLNILAVTTIVLMVTANAAPKWYEMDQAQTSAGIEVGIWRVCVTTDVRRCKSSLKDSDLLNVNHTLRNTQAFVVMAVLLASTTTVLIIFMEFNKKKPKWIGLPRFLFAASAFCMFIAALSFVGYVEEENLGDRPDPKYGASFVLAWISIGTAMGAALVAHFHHTTMAQGR